MANDSLPPDRVFHPFDDAAARREERLFELTKIALPLAMARTSAAATRGTASTINQSAGELAVQIAAAALEAHELEARKLTGEHP